MGTLEEQLARQEWDPAPGDKLIGTITEIKAREARNGNLYPVLVVKDGDGSEYIVSCALMASDVIAARPVPGDRVGIRFDGPQPKANGDGTWDRYVIAFDREKPAEVDWDRMAAGRNTPVTPAANGRQAQPAGTGDWSGQPADTGFTEEPPF
jgi:hypothetical protein